MRKILPALLLGAMLFTTPANAQGPEPAAERDFPTLILSAKNDNELAPILEEAKNSYFQSNKYQAFIDLLNLSLKKKKNLAPWAAYYTGIARYRQMKYLEETQNWDEYFSRGNEYRQDITDNLERSLKNFAVSDPEYLYSRLILWQFHKDQLDVFTAPAFESLIADTKTYAASAEDLSPVLAVADTLIAYEERSKAREIYKLYGDRIISSQVSEEDLQNSAMSFYKTGNIELATALYAVYVDRIVKSASPEKVKLELIDIAKLFSYKKDAAFDLDYAEKIFERLELEFGGQVFDEDLSYQRAFNLEKNKDYSAAKQKYLAFIEAYPQSDKYRTAFYKSGLISLYIEKDISAAADIFQKLADIQAVSPQAISGLYQLGLIAQWQQEPDKAKGFYSKLMEQAQNGFKETVLPAKARLAEIEESKPLEFNIKTLLDVTFRPENNQFNSSRAEIEVSSYMAEPGQTLTISSKATPPESGCMQVQLQYFWSGETGSGKTLPGESSFTASYSDPGTKLIGLVVTTPAGVVDRAVDFIDVD
jgi:TolA-binding protein